MTFTKAAQLTKSPKKKVKKVSVAKMKKKVWTEFSKYIRLRDALRSTGTLTHIRCVTCQKRYEIGQCHAGHFIPGRKGFTLFDERGVHGQCGVCNLWLKGNPVEYWLYMEKQYGREIIDELIERNKQIKQYTISELETMLSEYKNKVKELNETLC